MLLIIDGNNLAHRCRHVFSLSHNGVDVSVTFGFIKVLHSLMNKYNPDSVLVAWDGGIPEFRRRIVPSYKAGRVKGDPDEYADFLRQMDVLSNIMPRMGVISIRVPGAEADDIMYHAAKIQEDGNVVIVSSDKDMFQCIQDGVRVLNPARDKEYDRNSIIEEYGIQPEHFIHWRSIQGDSSDNIPGVPGIGEKTATKLFEKYKSISGIINAAEGRNPEGDLTGKVADSIKAFGDSAITKNIMVMALYIDRTGVKREIIEGLRTYNGYNHAFMKSFLMKNAFVSLMDGQFYKLLRNLSAFPVKNDIRIPIATERRRIYATTI